MDDKRYDVVIIGAGIAGSALAHALATLPGLRPWRIALIERSFSEPDRFVGEIMQPSGLEALDELGMASALDGTGAVPVKGYNLLNGNDSVVISFPVGEEGRSFHHGRFVAGLRRIALKNINVHPIEATAMDLIECSSTERITGVTVIPRGQENEKGLDIHGDLVVVADGCFSKFRQSVLQEAFTKPEQSSYTIAGLMKDTTTMLPCYATLVLPEGLGPIYMYQVGDNESRILIDLPVPLPKDLKRYILDDIVPKLPEAIHESVTKAFTDGHIRKMPCSFLPPFSQANSSSRKGSFLLGDSYNMRHPLTGSGMTIALKDIVYLRKAIEESRISSFKEWDKMSEILRQWNWARKSHGAASLNLMASCTYAMVRYDDGVHGDIRRGIMKYLTRGEGTGLQKLAAILSGKATSPVAVVKHYALIALYSWRLLFTQPTLLSRRHGVPAHGGKTTEPPLTVVEYGQLVVETIVATWTAIAMVAPFIWSEIRWWSPRRR